MALCLPRSRHRRSRRRGLNVHLETEDDAHPASKNGFILVSVRGLKTSAVLPSSYFSLCLLLLSLTHSPESNTWIFGTFEGGNLEKVTKVSSFAHEQPRMNSARAARSSQRPERPRVALGPIRGLKVAADGVRDCRGQRRSPLLSPLALRKSHRPRLPSAAPISRQPKVGRSARSPH